MTDFSAEGAADISGFSFSSQDEISAMSNDKLKEMLAKFGGPQEPIFNSTMTTTTTVDFTKPDVANQTLPIVTPPDEQDSFIEFSEADQIDFPEPPEVDVTETTTTTDVSTEQDAFGFDLGMLTDEYKDITNTAVGKPIKPTTTTTTTTVSTSENIEGDPADYLMKAQQDAENMLAQFRKQSGLEGAGLI